MKKTVSIILLVALVLACVLFAGIKGCIPAEPTSRYNNPMGLPDEMLDALTEYLRKIHADVDYLPRSTVQKLNEIKDGAQGLHVAFDPSDFYYVCGYYNPAHENGIDNAYLDKAESHNYCCAREYIWVKFDSEKDIRDSYDNAPLMVAFQINNAQICRDVVPSEKTVPGFVHYQLYKPEFKNGINIAEPIAFNETFIYVNASEQSAIYYSAVDIYHHSYMTLPCVNLEEEYYIPVLICEEHPDGGRYEKNLQGRFGEYYDAIMEVLITDKYSISTENGYVQHYGLINTEDIVKLIKNEQGGN